MHERVLITLACGHTTMGERICSLCVAYYESVPCDLCATGDEPDPPHATGESDVLGCEDCESSVTLLIEGDTK
jgi:hypothetical protein